MNRYTLPLAALLLAAPVWGDPAPPVARTLPVTDTLFGHTVTDPYRWMEQPNSPEFAAYMRGQADYAHATLDKIPGRAALLARIQALDKAGVSVRDVQEAGGKYFYQKTLPDDDNAKLCVRDGMRGPERILLDPQTLTTGGVNQSLLHWDMVCDLRSGGRITADGETIHENGQWKL